MLVNDTKEALKLLGCHSKNFWGRDKFYQEAQSDFRGCLGQLSLIWAADKARSAVPEQAQTVKPKKGCFHKTPKVTK